MYLFDPRKGDLIETNNPVIILADIMIRNGLVKPNKSFWAKIKKLADIADEKGYDETKNTFRF